MAQDIVRLTTEEELRRIHTEAFINRNSKVNKVVSNGVLAALIAGNAKTAKKALKDIQLAVSQIYPSSASGTALDRSAADFGIGGRLPASQASVVVKLIADPGTVYQAGVHTVSSNNGFVYDLEENITISTKGFGYVKARAQDSGTQASVEAFEITQANLAPPGHIAVTNEYKSVGGRDLEQDDVFRIRIKKGANTCAEGTLAKYTQAFLQVNDNVLRVFNRGVSDVGKIRIAVASQNGINFTQAELDQMLETGSSFFAWTDLNPTHFNDFGIELINVEYQFVEVNFRISLFENVNVLDVIREIQPLFSKSVDYRFWKPGIDRVDRLELLNIVRAVSGVRFVPEVSFFPNSDIVIDADKLPRFSRFTVLDLDGNLILDQSGIIDPIYFPEDLNVGLDSVADFEVPLGILTTGFWDDEGQLFDESPFFPTEI